MDHRAAATHQARRGPLLVVSLALLAVILGAAGWAWRASPPGEPARSAATSIPGAAGVPAGTTVAQPHPVRPTHLRISSIDVSAAVTSLGIHADRTVEVPQDPDQAGWYRLGSLPGQPGSAVILGHVDSTEGPAVFSRLRLLRPGAEVEVLSSDGSTTRFVVTAIATYANADFPAQKVYRSRGRPGLALVTCGGRYDAARGGYQANVVVYAALVGRTAS